MSTSLVAHHERCVVHWCWLTWTTGCQSFDSAASQSLAGGKVEQMLVYESLETTMQLIQMQPST